MTRKKGARESTDEPLTKTSGRQKRFRDESETRRTDELPRDQSETRRTDELLRERPEDRETEPPPPEPASTDAADAADAAASPPPRALSGPLPRGQRRRDSDRDLETATSALRRKFDLEDALGKAGGRDQPPPSFSFKAPLIPSELAEPKPPPLSPKSSSSSSMKRDDSSPPASGASTLRPRMPMSCVPRRAMSKKEILQAPLDHRMGFVLGLIDGETNVRTIIDVSGMPDSEVIAVIERLLALRVILLA